VQQRFGLFRQYAMRLPTVDLGHGSKLLPDREQLQNRRRLRTRWLLFAEPGQQCLSVHQRKLLRTW
jgi:hypothetical protein